MFQRFCITGELVYCAEYSYSFKCSLLQLNSLLYLNDNSVCVDVVLQIEDRCLFGVFILKSDMQTKSKVTTNPWMEMERDRINEVNVIQIACSMWLWLENQWHLISKQHPLNVVIARLTVQMWAFSQLSQMLDLFLFWEQICMIYAICRPCCPVSQWLNKDTLISILAKETA